MALAAVLRLAAEDIQVRGVAGSEPPPSGETIVDFLLKNASSVHLKRRQTLSIGGRPSRDDKAVHGVSCPCFFSTALIVYKQLVPLIHDLDHRFIYCCRWSISSWSKLAAHQWGIGLLDLHDSQAIRGRYRSSHRTGKLTKGRSPPQTESAH